MPSLRQFRNAVWRWLLRPDGFKAGVLTVGLLLALYFRIQNQPDSTFRDGLRSLDARLIDWMFNLRGGKETVGDCVIIDVDDKSLAELGQWPWPRTVIADLLRKVSADEPRAIGMDMVFAEPDRLSPRRFAAELESVTGHRIELPDNALDNDVVLGDALAEGLPVVLGYLFVLERDQVEPPDQVPFPDCNINWVPPDARAPLLRAWRPLLNVPAIEDGATTEAFWNAWVEGDAVVRQVPLFIEYGDMPYPGLALEMYRMGTGAKTYDLVCGSGGMLGVKVGDTFIPTTPDGMATLNWRGRRGAFPYISVCDVLAGRVSAGRFKDKYVFIGSSAGGLHDLRSSPMGSLIPGVEFHATLVDNILQGDLFHRDQVRESGIVTFGLIVGGIALAAVLTYCPALLGVLFGILVLLWSVAANYYIFFLRNVYVGVAFPLMSIVLIIVVVMSVNYLMEDRKKAYIRHAFGHYVSGRVVDRLMRDPQSLTLSGEEREMSIMFSDIRGFTGLSEQFDAAGLASFLNEYLTEMTDILLAEDGTLDKFIGDAVMAFWNAPSDQEDHAARAIGCALRMQARLAELRKGWEERGLPPVKIGIGIATGPASVGNMGSRDRFNYTVMGDTVNLSSRLEGLTKNYGVGILVSEPALNAASWQEHSRYVDQVRVKGRSEPVRIFEPLTRPQGAEEADLWHHVIGAYLAGQFDRARQSLSKLRIDYPDPLYDVYHERLLEFETHPPENWDGVYTHTTK
jgi:adenylate cyclase